MNHIINKGVIMRGKISEPAEQTFIFILIIENKISKNYLFPVKSASE